jgi:hypothetical protein
VPDGPELQALANTRTATTANICFFMCFLLAPTVAISGLTSGQAGSETWFYSHFALRRKASKTVTLMTILRKVCRHKYVE